MLNLRNEVPTPKAGVNAEFVIAASRTTKGCPYELSSGAGCSCALTVIVVSVDLEASRYVTVIGYSSGGLLRFITWVFHLVTVNPRGEQLIGHRQYHRTDEDTD